MLVFSKQNLKTANAYISILELKDIFAEDIFLDEELIENLEDEKLESLVINSTFMLDNLFNLKGEKYYKEQSLAFPRNFEKPEISVNVKKFICFLVQQLLTDKTVFSQNFKANSESQVQKEKLDVLETVYFENKAKESLVWTSKLNQYAMLLMKEYFVGKRANIELIKGF